jgi:GT2 family glycosyltransferase
VVIPALNEETRLAPTLEALGRQTVPASLFEVIVVDGGSSDRTVEIAEQWGARCVRSPRGHGRQRNAGARAARADWLAFLDADCTPSEDWVEVALENIERGGADLFGAPVLTPPGGTWVQRAWGAHLASRRAFASGEGSGVARFLTTQNLVASRALFVDVGGFDEELTSGEDYLFVVGAEAMGARVRCEPRLRVTHRGEPGTLRQFWRQQVWHSNRDAWRKIAQATAGRVGGNARTYGLITGLGAAVALVAAVVAVYTGRWWVLGAAVAAHAALPVGLAVRTARRAGMPGVAPSLALLYWLFGWARASHVLGVARIAEKKDRFRHVQA